MGVVEWCGDCGGWPVWEMGLLCFATWGVRERGGGSVMREGIRKFSEVR
jgi:hypothetical protein